LFEDEEMFEEEKLAIGWGGTLGEEFRSVDEGESCCVDDVVSKVVEYARLKTSVYIEKPSSYRPYIDQPVNS
jgi:hypothetical protein